MAKIAIVEDDKNISEIESFALKNSGYEVEVYGTATDFFEGIKTNCHAPLHYFYLKLWINI